MRSRQVVLVTAAGLAAVVASLILVAALASAQPISQADLFSEDGPLSTQAAPVTFPTGPWPPYAHGALSVHPEPPIAGHPAELCAVVANDHSTDPLAATIEFGVSDFGIGLPFAPVGQADVEVPPGGEAVGCVVWVPPEIGHWCIQARLMVDGFEDQIAQRNMDVDEPLRAETPHSRTFVVGNNTGDNATITLELVPHLVGWALELSQDILPDMEPGSEEVVTLTVTPPTDLPSGMEPIVDVEASVEGELVGGFRKIFRPPVLLHRFPDPPYAEREISVHPYPLQAGEPTEVCVELRNPTDDAQEVIVLFSWAEFGIGLPFNPINGPRPVPLPPHSIVNECIHWIPPTSGNVCIQVEMEMDGYAPQSSRRNMDADEPLEATVPHSRPFLVRNPHDRPVTITLDLIPYLPDWGIELSADVLSNVPAFGEEVITLTVTPPPDLPPDGHPIVDVEASVEGEEAEFIGGFRKIFRPPVPIHRPQDPIYAESEIGIDPYPIIPGQPVEFSVEVFNPTDEDHVVTTTFSVAPFGIGLPFTTTGIAPNPIHIFVPARGAARGHVIWHPLPGWHGKFCVQVTLGIGDHETVWSRRNIDVGEPLEQDVPHSLVFEVGNPSADTVTTTLGLIAHLPGWTLELSPDTLPGMMPGAVRPVTLTVTPPADARLGSGEPIVDVEAYVEGELVGGFRKMNIPPIPLHKPHEKGYAESEISIEPYPPQQGQPTQISATVQNSSDVAMTVNLEFGWAKFGMGIPFSTTGIVDHIQAVTLDPGMTKIVGVTWTPSQSGHQCVRILLNDPDGQYEPQESQRNVDVTERTLCGTNVYTFTVLNDSDITTTVDIGLITFNVPAGWQVTTTPSDTLELCAGCEGVVLVTVNIPCPSTSQDLRASQTMYALQEEAGSVPTVNVEGYVTGRLVGGIELQFEGEAEWPNKVYLPLVLRNR